MVDYIKNYEYTGISNVQFIPILRPNKSYVNHLPAQVQKKEKNPWFFKKEQDKIGKTDFKEENPKKEEKINGIISERNMLPRENRMKSKKDFGAVFLQGRTFEEGFLLLKIYRTGLGDKRAAFVISQKAIKKASARNKIRRQLRAIMGQKIRELKEGFNLVFIVRAGFEGENFPKLKETVEELLKKAGILEVSKNNKESLPQSGRVLQRK